MKERTDMLFIRFERLEKNSRPSLTDSFGRSSGILLSSASEQIRSGLAPVKASQGHDKGPVCVLGRVQVYLRISHFLLSGTMRRGTQPFLRFVFR